MKLYIPGPVQVSEKTFRAFCRPMIGHRSGEFKKLYGGIQPRLKELFQTEQPVFLSTSSAWGVMEGAVRNLVGDGKVLNCMCGAFSDKWLDVSRKCGKQAEALQVEWGQPIRGEQVRAKLKEGGYQAVTVIHNETSTGVMSPLQEICEVLREFPRCIADRRYGFFIFCGAHSYGFLGNRCPPDRVAESLGFAARPRPL